MEGRRARGFLSKIRLTGAAGVDEPAHGVPGWIVMKSANDDLQTMLNEVLEPERERIRSQRAEVEEVKQMILENQRALDELEQMVGGSIQKSATDSRDEVEELVEKTARLAQWVGFGKGQEAARPKVGSGVEAARLFWGLVDE